MATLRLQIKGQKGRISLLTFLTATASTLRMLEELDLAISGVPKGSLEWFVTDLSMGSLTVQMDSRSRFMEKRYDSDVTEAFLGAMRLIEGQGGVPPYLSEFGMRQARKLVRVIGHDGADGLSVQALNQTVEVTERASEGVAVLTRIRRRAIGSVEGKLETISIHGGRPRFIAYHSRTHKAITCKITSDTLLSEAKEALGRRVRALGTVSSNAMGEPLRVEVKDIHVLRRDEELPHREQIRGSAPGMTGDLTTEEFIRSIRGG